MTSETAAVRIAEVFPRDGLQTLLHEPGLRQPTTDEKIDFIQRVAATGVPEIEITGFVHPRVIPQLADAEAVATAVVGRLPGTSLRALVPNLRGAERAIACGADATVPESVEHRLQPLAAVYRRRALGAVRASLARGENKVTRFYSRVRCQVLPWRDIARQGFARRIFDNMNMPDDYERVLCRLGVNSLPHESGK